MKATAHESPGGHGLSPAKRQLMEQRLRRMGSVSSNADKNFSAPSDAPPRPSLAQEGIWRLHQVADQPSCCVIPSAFWIDGPIDEAALTYALRQIIRRHTILSSAYAFCDDRIEISFVETQPTGVETIAVGNSESMLDAASAFIQRPFALDTGPLLRLGLISAASDRHLLVLAIHHIICDEWSLRVFWREFAAFYREAATGASANLPPLALQFLDFSPRQRVSPGGSEHQRQLHYWRNQLSNTPPPLAMPTDRPYPTVISFRGELVSFDVSAATAQALAYAAAAANTTVANILLLGYGILLRNLTQADDLVIATPIANRRHPDVVEMIGNFLNTLPMRINLSGDPSCAGALMRMKETTHEAYAHPDLTFEEIRAALELPRTAGRHALAQTMFVYQGGSERAPKLSLPACAARPALIGTGGAKYDLTLFVGDADGGGFRVIAEYRSDLFDAESITLLLARYGATLDQIGQDPNQRISAITALSAEEARSLQTFEKGPELPPSPHQTILDLIGNWRNSDKLAIESAALKLTHRQLAERSDALALRLVALDAQANQPIALYLDRSPHAIIGLLGILKAGAPYLPIDPSYPTERTRLILDDSATQIVVTHDALRHNPALSGKRLALVEPIDEAYPESTATKMLPVALESMAYLIYTSGSTGTPKAVSVSHRNLLASTTARIAFYEVPPQRFALVSSLSFDSSVAGVFWTLATGGALAIPTIDETRDPERMSEIIERGHIDTFLGVPSYYEQLLDWNAARLRSLRRVIVAGETCSPHLVKRHADRLPSCALFNEYGPTEATVWASVHRCDADRGSAPSASVPIGRPIPGSIIRLLDTQRKRVPIGIVGELCIGGHGLTDGYRNDAERTAERFFVADDGTKLYATGDYARWTPAGLLQYCGRNDEQIKIRGHRVELGEIEARLRALPGVRDAAVVAMPIGSASAPEPKLEDLLARLPASVVEEALQSIKSDRSEPVSLRRQFANEDFEFNLQIKSPSFIAPPRPAQRDWVVSQAINELRDDLEHLNRVAARFVPGKDHKLGTDLIDIRTAALSDDQIMESWQTPLMKEMANYAAASRGHVLEVGFGRGVSAEFVQSHRPVSHTIIEMNPICIERHFAPWRLRHKSSTIELREGRWQDALPSLGLFDGVLFHTYPMNEDEFVEYVLNSVTFAEHAFESMAAHLKPGGAFTYLSAEIDSISRRHQRALLQHFSEISFKVVPVSVPPDTIDSWWSDRMVAVRAVK